MDASDLQGGFRIGDWTVEPVEASATGPGGRRALTREQVALLLALAERAGTPVSRGELRARAWPGQSGMDHLLSESMRALRELFGGRATDRRYIVPDGHSGFVLAATVAPVVPSPQPAAGEAAGPTSASSPAGRLRPLFVELHRRRVFKALFWYVATIGSALQGADLFVDNLGLATWVMPTLIVIGVVGVPIVVALAWLYDITPAGIVLDAGAPGVPHPRLRVAPVIMLGVALMATVVGAAWLYDLMSQHSAPGPTPAAHPASEVERRSVAVLPLTDMSAGGGSGYLGDGLSEELSTRLAQITGLRVAARTSAFEYKGRNVDVRRIGELLGVHYVLEGSVRRAGDNLRVTVQLVDATNGYHVWAESYDRSWQDVIAIQDDIARSVTDALRVVLAPEPSGPRGPEHTPDVHAYDSYFEALAVLHQSGDTSRLREAETRFKEAIAVDPSFARAHAGLCEVGVRLYVRTRDPAYVEQAEEQCRKALDLDSGLVETEKALGGLYAASGRLGEAEAIYRGLIARNPGDADGQIGLGRALEAAGRFDEAEASYRAAVEAEPSYWGGYRDLGVFLTARGRVAEAAEAFRKVTEITPASANAYSNYGAVLQLQGDFEGSLAAFSRSLAIEPSAAAYSNVGTAYYFLHKFPEAVTNYQRATEMSSLDQIYWSSLADALWQMPQRRGEAPGYYRRAVELAERELETKGGRDAQLLAQLAYYCGRLGEPERSAQYLERAVELKDTSPFVAYYAAMAETVAGHAAAAGRYASLAVESGYPRFLLDADPVLGKAAPR